MKRTLKTGTLLGFILYLAFVPSAFAISGQPSPTPTPSPSASPISVSITTPKASANITLGTVVSLTATATGGSSGLGAAGNNVGQMAGAGSANISSVQFQLDGSNLGSALVVPPYSMQWSTNGLVVGNHALVAVATDLTGVRKSSAAVSILLSKVTDNAAPSIPAGLKSSNITATGVTLSWNASTDNVGVAGYRVYKGGVLLTSVSSLTTTVAGLTAGTAYSFQVSSYDAAGNASALSAALNVTTSSAGDVTAPSVPGSVRSSNISTSGVTLTWNASTDNVGVAGYRVYKNGALLVSVNALTTPITGLSAGTSYSFQVTSYDAAGNASALSPALNVTTASPSVTDTAPPSVPLGLGSSNVTTNSVTLSWSASTDNVGVSGYRVYRNGAQISSTGALSSTDSGLSANTSYSYQVAAYDAVGNMSALSAALSVKTQAITGSDTQAPSVPAVFTAQLLTMTSSVVPYPRILTSWSKSSDNVGVAGYNFKYTYNKTPPFTGVGQVQSETLLFFLSPSTAPSYTFSASAYDAVGNVSAYSTAFTVVPNFTPMYRIFSTASGSVGTVTNSVAVDAFDHLVVCGTISGPTNMGSSNVITQTLNPVPTSAGAPSADLYVAKYNTDGSLVWAKNYGGSGNDSCADMKLDSSGNIYVGGAYTDQITLGTTTLKTPIAKTTGSFIAKLDTNGNPLWALAIQDPSITNASAVTINSIGVSPAGTVAVVGSFSASLQTVTQVLKSKQSQDVWVAEFNSSGALQWLVGIGGGGSGGGAIGQTTRVNTLGDVFVSGVFAGGGINFGSGLKTASGNSNDIFVGRLKALDGSEVWSQSFGGSSADDAFGMDLDSQGNVVLTGQMSGSFAFGTGAPVLTASGASDIFVAKLDPNGKHLWSKAMGGSDIELGVSLKIDKWDHIYIGATFVHTTTIDGHYHLVDFVLGQPVTSSSNNGLMIELDANGLYLYSVNSSASNGVTSILNSIAVDSKGGIYGAGYYNGFVDLGFGVPLTPTSGMDGYLLRF